MIIRTLAVVLVCSLAAAQPKFTYKCSSALECVDENLCDLQGVIVTSPVSFSQDELAFGQPRVICKKPQGGEGVCCRNPNYQDDWPANYVDPGLQRPNTGNRVQGDAGARPPPSNNLGGGAVPPRPPVTPAPPPPRPPPPQRPVPVPVPQPQVPVFVPAPPPQVPVFDPQPPPPQVPVFVPQPVVVTEAPFTPPKIPKKPIYGNKKQKDVVYTGCPERNRTALPDLNPGAWVAGDFESGHGEFLWQAAIFDADFRFLCGCYLTDLFTCTTTATCVKAFTSNPGKLRVVVAAYDLTEFEVFEPNGTPKISQVGDVQEVTLDPNGRDIAVVYIDVKNTPIEYNYYTAPICVDLPEGLRVFDYDNCVITGWGTQKRTPHWYDVELLSESECGSLVRGFNPKFQSCARADVDICDQVEFGNGLQCRYRGNRSDRDVRDVYWLRGVFNDWTCDPGNNIIVYTHLDMGWFDRLLKKRQDYLLTIY